MRALPATLSLFFAMLPAALLAQQEAKAPRLVTRWAKTLDRAAPHKEYPRPGMRRASWQNLNGSWDYAILEASAPRMEKPQGQILVPFPVESWLSGVQRGLDSEHRLDYRRRFKVPEHVDGQRVLLHFEAVDWQATVSVNGVKLGVHRGGYDPFAFDITKALAKSPGAQEAIVEVSVLDPTNEGTQPRGKQALKPGGIWYTPSSGIWQSVWLEVVPATYIRDLELDASFLGKRLKLRVDLGPEKAGLVGGKVRVSASLAGKQVARGEGPVERPLVLQVSDARAWSPTSPTLYDLRVELLDRSEEVVDTVESYFGMRDVSVGKDATGHRRLFLNGRALYQHGPLDQGFWPDGLYTAPSDAALRYDLEVTKKLGFNMVRKHVKVESRRWYYHCDQLGLLVWQDMPNGGAHAPATSDPGKREILRDADSARQFERELKAMIQTHRRHPCIVIWVPFNEGWGQYDTQRIAKLVKTWDPSRIVNCASGWNDFPAGDVYDIHRYPGPAGAPPRQARVTVLGEFGGLGLPIAGHTWQQEKNWGYRKYETKAGLEKALHELLQRMPLLIAEGLAASVYTQTTDVESEVNGLMTYDRVLKIDPARLRELHSRLYEPPANLDPVRSRPVTVFLVRHAEKIDDSRDPELSKAGLERAQALARLLGQARVTHLFASEYKRTQTTLSPISKATGLRITTISARSPKKQVAALAALPPGAVAVVAGHSNTIPKLCQLLAGDAFARNPEPKIADDSYDRLFMVTMQGGGGRNRATPQCIELRYGSRGK